MRFIDSCANCGSTSQHAWGATVGPRQLHFCQSRCRGCGLIFSNPQADETVVAEYYRGTYWDEHWAAALSTESETVRRSVEEQNDEVKRIMNFCTHGRLLEVGSGTGTFLRAAQNAGFEVQGVEYSTSAVEFSRTIHGLQNVICGSLEVANLPAGYFNVIFAWHVIEHVLDLDFFVRRLHDLLAPGGILWIGTETYQNATHYMTRAARLLGGEPPPFATSTEHTFAFTATTLSDVLRRRGFEVLLTEAYQPTLAERLRPMRFRTPLGRAYFIALHMLNRVFRTGPLLRMVVKKPLAK